MKGMALRISASPVMTLDWLMPGMSGVTALPPTAEITASGFTRRASVMSNSWFRRSCTFSLRNWTSK